MTTTAVAKKPTLAERHKTLAETLERVENDRQLLAESLSNAVSMLRQEDAGWAGAADGEQYKGLTLDQARRWSEQIRAALTGTASNAPNPHMRNGLMLRHSFIWNGGIHYDGIPGSDNTGRRGKANVQKLIDEKSNQRNFFGSTARRQREEALYSAGLYLVVGENSSKKLRAVPMHEITDTFRDPLYQDEIIAYRWTRKEAVAYRSGPRKGMFKPEREEKNYWVYVDWFDGDRATAVNYNGQIEPVLKGHTAFDLHANRPDGHAFGSPDAISALIWARIIRDLIMNGVKMQDALAMFAFKATSPSKSGQQGMALELAGSQTAGSAATMGVGNEFDALASAGKGYDFGSIGFVVSTMASSLHVSGIALSANTALAGSSYGAAKTLDLPGQMAMETRRAEHIEFDLRVLTWMGAEEATVYFDTFEDSADEYRAVQAAMLAWTTGTLTPEGFRAELEIIYGRKLVGEIPKGVIVPNNQKAIDDAAAAKVAADKAAAEKTAAQQAAPDQGRSSGAGSADHAGDIAPKVK